MKSILMLVLVLNLAASGQRQSHPPPQVDLSPRANLTPRLYQELRGDSPLPFNLLDRFTEQLEQMDKRTAARLAGIQDQYLYLVERQKVISEQLIVLVDLNKAVIVSTERLAAMEHRLSGIEGRIQHNEDLTSSAPRSIAILETKVDAIARFAIWLMAGVGSLVTGAIVFLAKRRIAAMLKRRQ